MAKNADAESTARMPRRKAAEERGSPSRSTSETSTVFGKFQRQHSVEAAAGQETRAPKAAKPSTLLDTRVVYCGDNLEQFAKLPDGPCRTGHHWGSPREITPRATLPHRLHRISLGETKEKRAFEDRHENTKAYIDYMRPRCVLLARVLKSV